MSWYEILIIVLAAAFVAAVVIWQIVRRVQGKSGCSECGGNCPGCGGCSACRTAERKKKN